MKLKINELFTFILCAGSVGGQIFYWHWYATNFTSFSEDASGGLAFLGIILFGTFPLVGYISKELFE